MNNESEILFDTLIKKNWALAEIFSKSKIMQLINSDSIHEKLTREKLLSCLQLFSDYFQKAVMVRHATTFNEPFISISQKHINEEINHNLELLSDRGNRPATWDPILEATSSWFTWKMLSSDSIEKTLLMHLVLESSANVFFKSAHEIMSKYYETNFFEVHSSMDSEHEKMGFSVLKDLRPQEYQNLFKIQYQGWEMITAACDRMEYLTLLDGSENKNE